MLVDIVYTTDLKKYISICRQAHYSTQRFSLTGRACVRIHSFSAMSIHSIRSTWELDSVCILFLALLSHCISQRTTKIKTSSFSSRDITYISLRHCLCILTVQCIAKSVYATTKPCICDVLLGVMIGSTLRALSSLRGLRGATCAVRETASLGIMGAPRVPPLNPSESIVLSGLS